MNFCMVDADAGAGKLCVERGDHMRIPRLEIRSSNYCDDALWKLLGLFQIALALELRLVP